MDVGNGRCIRGEIMSIVNNMIKALGDIIQISINHMLVSCMGYLDQITFDFWSNDIIKGFLAFSMWINGVVFVLGFVFSLFDAAEEAGSMKQIDWLAVTINFIKGFLFVDMYSYLAIGIMQIANILTTSLNLRISINGGSKFLDTIKDIGSTQFFNGIMPLCVIIAIIFFIVISIKRFGTMLIQIFSSAFYIVDIVRGETIKLGDWLRQTIAIAFTYTFQYILFYIGFILIMGNNGIVDTLIAFGLWMSMGGVSQVLAKYGYSSGIKGGSTFSSLANQGLSLLTKH